MTRDPSQRLAQILRDTLRRVEVSAHISPDDHALLELRRILLLKIASLEADTPERESGTDRLHRPVRAA